MVFVLIWAIVGGTTTFFGPIIGVVALTIINEIILRSLGFDSARPMIYGALLILSVLFLPKGLEGLVQKAGRIFKARKAPEPAVRREQNA